MNPRKIAILDCYDGHPNQGMRCIMELVRDAGLDADLYDVRSKAEVPDAQEYEMFLSTGGPGDPHEVCSTEWGEKWQDWLEDVRRLNAESSQPRRNVFLICHSYQMACIIWGLAEVTRRYRPAFGIYPLDKTLAGREDASMARLADPFYVIDSREWQVVQPDAHAMHDFGARIIAIERDRPHVPLERAAMAIRFTPEIVGTQFHPEADESGMEAYINDPESLTKLAGKHGIDRIEKIQAHLGDPQKVNHTHASMLPAFLRSGVVRAR